MKKTLLCLFTLLLATTALHAQDEGFRLSMRKADPETPAAVSGTPQLDSIKNEFEQLETIPSAELYDLFDEEWTGEKVNPYGAMLKDIPSNLMLDIQGICFPLVCSIYVTSEYGYRWGRTHHGIDLRISVGDSVVSVLDGMVRVVGRSLFGYGNYVVIRHHNGLETVYAHLNKIDVVKNQTVKAGECIGEAGNTGRSTGPHLHFETRYLGLSTNPRRIIDFSGEMPSVADTVILLRNDFTGR